MQPSLAHSSFIAPLARLGPGISLPVFQGLEMYSRSKRWVEVHGRVLMLYWIQRGFMHSGTLRWTVLHAGVFNEPLSDLMKVLASLVDAENRILVPGFYDKVSGSMPWELPGLLPELCLTSKQSVK